MDDIRKLIENWARAVHEGDLDQVTAQHTDDIVMFDVPPPYEGVRGIGAYRDTWPGFFEWQRSGAVFDIEELDVVAGADVAYAFAIARCADATDDSPVRLRLTFGLKMVDGQWRIAHEHHSFPSELSGEDEIRALGDL
ncbi:nuclear transport factor 2 family protein [Herbidospora mongoliensis]|uniref:nuclear transport factor 2 family protein n=1 Tax=Herbidospora mongoliensis TaxID=688067 RepID=UPI00082E5C78|nr:nuclear transport factor 2 family protein [Herbidospora mongoliensis]